MTNTHQKRRRRKSATYRPHRLLSAGLPPRLSDDQDRPLHQPRDEPAQPKPLFAVLPPTEQVLQQLHVAVQEPPARGDRERVEPRQRTVGGGVFGDGGFVFGDGFVECC